MSFIHSKSAFAKASATNAWSPAVIRGHESKAEFAQSEVMEADLPDDIRGWISESFQQSGDGYAQSKEVGFFVAAQIERNTRSAYATSYLRTQIVGRDVRKSMDDLFNQLRSVDHDTVLRFQYYHTHPHGPGHTSISSRDVDTALNMHAILIARDIARPLDFHAMPHGSRGVLMRMTLGQPS